MIVLNGERTNNIPLRVQMLTGKMRGIVIVAKAVFQLAIKTYANSAPRPTKSNCKQELSLKLLDAKDKFFKKNPNPPRKDMMNDAWDILVREIEHNDEYHPFWDSLIEIIKEV